MSTPLLCRSSQTPVAGEAFAQIPIVNNISGGLVLGNYMLLLFLATNGAVSVIARIIEIGSAIFYFTLGTVLIHGVIIFGIDIMLKIDSKVIAIASQANVGGGSSAMTIAGARGVPHLISPGVAVGFLGTALGNYIGFLIANIMKVAIAEVAGYSAIPATSGRNASPLSASKIC